MKISRTEVYNKFGGKCAYCGTDLKGKWQLDHIIPQRNFEHHIKNNWRIPEFLRHLTLSDLNHIDNCFPACCSCNNYKSTFDLELFRKEIQEQPKRLRSTKPTVRLAERFGLLTFNEPSVTFYFEHLTNQSSPSHPHP